MELLKIQQHDLDELSGLYKLVPHGSWIDILPWARLNLSKYLDEAIRLETQFNAWEGGIPHLHVISLNSSPHDRNTMITPDSEPDEVYFQYTKPWLKDKATEEQFIYNLANAIVIMLISDCTGCCNALSWMRLSEGGLYCHGNVSMTYHS